MKRVVNRNVTPWKRPWNLEKFDDLYNRDDRFFAVLTKGLMSWLNRNIVMYDKPINHFIFNTGSSYLYVEENGYEYKLNETTGEDYIYMQMPRCVMEISAINFPQEELTSPYSRGFYERRDQNNIRGFNAEIRRLPVEVSFSLKYVFSNFNESIVVLQEIMDKLIYQQYFNITYLGKIIKCSIEFPQDMKPEINKVDMASSEVNQRNLMFDVKICTNYPIINEKSEIPTDVIIQNFSGVIAGESITPDDINANISNIINNSDMNDEDKETLNEIVDNINKDGYNPDFDYNHDGTINEKDLDQFIDKLKEDGIIFDYDKMMNKIYIYHNNTDDDVIIDIEPYNFNSPTYKKS